MNANELTPAEKETVMRYDMKDRVYVVDTIVPHHVRRFTKLFGPGEQMDPQGTMRWTIDRMPSLPAARRDSATEAE